MFKISKGQREAVEKIRNGNIVVGKTGSGKTFTSLVYFIEKVCLGSWGCGDNPCERPITPKDLYVFTTAKKRDDGDWEREAEMVGISQDENDSYGGIKMTVDSWNNIHKYVDVEDAFFIFDEQRLVGNGLWVKSFLKIVKKNEWILLSATPGDNWMDYVPVLIANGFYRNRTDFYDRHVIFKPYGKFRQVDRYVATGVLKKRVRSIIVDIPYERHTLRHVKYVDVSYIRNDWDVVSKKRWNPFQKEPIRESGELAFLMRLIVNIDHSRIEKLWEIYLEKRKLIVFYNFDMELDLIKDFLDNEGIVYGERNGRRNDPIPDGDDWLYLVQYTSGAEGWNCIETNTIVFYSMNYSYRMTEQAMGRVDRRNTPYTDLFYYFLVSKAPIDKALRSAIEKKKDFNEAIFLRSLSED